MDSYDLLAWCPDAPIEIKNAKYSVFDRGGSGMLAIERNDDEWDGKSAYDDAHGAIDAMTDGVASVVPIYPCWLLCASNLRKWEKMQALPENMAAYFNYLNQASISLRHPNEKLILAPLRISCYRGHDIEFRLEPPPDYPYPLRSFGFSGPVTIQAIHHEPLFEWLAERVAMCKGGKAGWRFEDM